MAGVAGKNLFFKVEQRTIQGRDEMRNHINLFAELSLIDADFKREMPIVPLARQPCPFNLVKLDVG